MSDDRRVNLSGTDLLPMDQVRAVAEELESTWRRADAMTCKIMSYGVHFQGRGIARHVCETHDFELGEPPQSLMCPIGRVEKAIEDGLAKIAAALGNPHPRNNQFLNSRAT